MRVGCGAWHVCFGGQEVVRNCGCVVYDVCALLSCEVTFIGVRTGRVSGALLEEGRGGASGCGCYLGARGVAGCVCSVYVLPLGVGRSTGPVHMAGFTHCSICGFTGPVLLVDVLDRVVCTCSLSHRPSCLFIGCPGCCCCHPCCSLCRV